jgi:hypothetical protein
VGVHLDIASSLLFEIDSKSHSKVIVFI